MVSLFLNCFTSKLLRNDRLNSDPFTLVSCYLLGINVYPGCMEVCFMSAVIMIPTWILITHHMDRLQHSTNRTKPIGGVFCTDGCVTTIEGPRLYRVSWHEKQWAKTTLPETKSKSPSEMMTFGSDHQAGVPRLIGRIPSFLGGSSYHDRLNRPA